MTVVEQAAYWSTIIGAPCAIVALVYAGLQLRHSVGIARGQFMLELERMVASHDPVHMRLRRGGDWSGNRGTPENPAEWGQGEDYMGFFEHCELLLQAGSLKLPSFSALFGYRVSNIMDNESIVQAKLVRERTYWELFLRLLDRLNIERP